MLSFTQDYLLVIFTVIASLLLILGMNRLWPPQTRRAHNELIGWQLTVLGTTYAVILGFMLYAVWTNFGAADLNCDLEANSLRNLYRVADGLPAAQREVLQQEAREYADAVIHHDWDDMRDGLLPGQSHTINQNMWK